MASVFNNFALLRIPTFPPAWGLIKILSGGEIHSAVFVSKATRFNFQGDLSAAEKDAPSTRRFPRDSETGGGEFQFPPENRPWKNHRRTETPTDPTDRKIVGHEPRFPSLPPPPSPFTLSVDAPARVDVKSDVNTIIIIIIVIQVLSGFSPPSSRR